MESFQRNAKRLKNRLPILAILVTVSLLMGGCSPANRAPQILGLESEHDLLSLGDSCIIECAASDEDGDELTYEWFAIGGKVIGEGPAVTWHAPEAEGVYNIMVKVTDPEGAEARDHVALTVKANLPPAIGNLAADRDWVSPRGSCRIECTASDPDGDELSYLWCADGGEISGSGPVVTWTAPDRVGLCNLAVAVSDGLDGRAESSLVLSVSLAPPPVIQDLRFTPQDEEYFQELAGGYKILKGRKCRIECVVKDPADGLLYQWTSAKGETLGDGPVLKWTAPEERGEVNIALTVSDTEGNMVGRNIVFKVETCRCAFR